MVGLGFKILTATDDDGNDAVVLVTAATGSDESSFATSM